MKIALLFFMWISLPALIFSQEEEQTLFGGDSLSVGFYGGPDFKISMINDEIDFFSGGRGGIILNGNFSIGGGGYDLIGSHELDIPLNGSTEKAKLDFGYGGLFLEYINSTNRAFHFTINSLIGWGTATYSKQFKSTDEYYDDEWDGCFVLEPGVSLEMNLTKNMRMDIGASYRWVQGTNFTYIEDTDLSGLSLNFTLKFGFFNKFIIPHEIYEIINGFKKKKVEEL